MFTGNSHSRAGLGPASGRMNEMRGVKRRLTLEAWPLLEKVDIDGDCLALKHTYCEPCYSQGHTPSISPPQWSSG